MIEVNQQIFPVTYATERMVLIQAGRLMGIDLLSHDLKRDFLSTQLNLSDLSLQMTREISHNERRIFVMIKP